MRDYAEVKNNGIIQCRSWPTRALSMSDVDAAGLDVMDRKFLEAILHSKFSGGPVGLENVAARHRRIHRHH